MGNRTLTYARTSGRSQDEKLSHGGQDTLMGQYCKGKGLHIVQPFYDVGSGLDTDERPGFRNMIDFAMEPENDIGHIVFPDLSRFTRGKADPYTYLQKLDERDIIIHSAHDGTNSDDDNDLLWDVTFIFNNKYSKEVSRLTIRGQTESVKMGNDICPVVAYGYEKYYVEDGGRQRPKWRPHPVHAEHIRTMFEMRDAKHLPMMICNHFNEKGIPAPRGGLWTTGTVIRMLRNTVYIGYSHIGIRSTSKFPRERRKRELVQNPNAHEPLVSEELFYRVQALMPKRSRAERPAPISHSSPNPLSYRVKCKNCGPEVNMIVRNSDDGKELMCSVKKNSGVRYCSTEDVGLEELLNLVAKSLKERLSTPEIIREQQAAIRQNCGEAAEQEKKRQGDIAKRLREIGKEKSNVMAGVVKAEMEYPENVEDFNQTLSALNKEKAKLEQERNEIDEETAELIAFLSDPEGLLEAILDIGTYIDTDDPVETARFLQAFIIRVDVSDEELTMYYSVPLPNTVKTEGGYKTSEPIVRGGHRILLEYVAPADAGLNQ